MARSIRFWLILATFFAIGMSVGQHSVRQPTVTLRDGAVVKHVTFDGIGIDVVGADTIIANNYFMNWPDAAIRFHLKEPMEMETYVQVMRDNKAP